ncbi:type 1 glutamine amidotransferase domain-containing protein [Paraflavisolibacter sp. H34]|uniref:type 1 glutamine amidotransferase domain-containing protein n=1 Tax=Huijunlia imazamoxiresistens TaxID=3127457 RepID=UPI00301A586A
MKVLIVLTSHSELGSTGKKTGFWLEEFAAPYYALKDAGAQVTLASPKGGQPPIDPKSEEPGNQTAATRRFAEDKALQEELAHTRKLSEVSAEEYDALFYPGGHGPLWDLATDAQSQKLIEDFWAANKPVAAVCHAPAVLLHVKNAQGEPFVQGKEVTGFTNTEEAAVGLTTVVPFLVEDELVKRGATYSKKDDWAPYVVTDGLLITGQNPASSEEAAHRLVALLERQLESY